MERDLAVLAVLGDPVRRSLYDYVSAQDHEVSRAEAAAATGVQRSLAAFHLDRLAEAGLVQVTFRRMTARRGPGAGRPAKLYRRAAGEHQVSVPPRDYRGAAEMLAGVVDVLGGEQELQRAARSRGAAAGRAALRDAAGAGHRDRLAATLSGQGYEPYADGPDVRLRNCPFHALAERYPPLICGMNLAWVEGLLEGGGMTGLAARLGPRRDECCVAVGPVGPSKSNEH